MLNRYKTVTLFFFKKHKKLMLIILGLSIFSSIFQVSMFTFILPILDFIEMHGNIDMTRTYWNMIYNFYGFLGVPVNIYTLALLNLCIVFVFQIIDYYRLIYIQYLSPLGMKEVREKIIKKILLSDLLNTRTYSKTYLVTLYSLHTAEYGNLFYRIFVFIFLIIQIMVYLTVLSFINIYLLFFIGIYILIIGIFTLRRGKFAKESGKNIADINDLIIKRISEIISSIKLLKVSNIEKEIFNKTVNDSNILIDKNFQIYKIKGLLNFIDTFNFIFLMSVLIISYKYFHIPLTEIIVFLFLLFKMVPLLKQINLEKIEIEGKYESASKIINFIKNIDNNKFITYDKNQKLKKINLNNIDFAYDDENILNNISLEFKQGIHYSIIGKSGSGKSTLINIILGLYNCTKGNIKYINIKDNEFNINEANIFYMSQEPIIITGTIKENLLFGLNKQIIITDEKLQEALEKVALIDFFETKDGLNTLIEEEGSNLSGGQKQRLALARLFVYEYDLIILDEHTSAVDKLSINIINKAVRDIKESIVINITHNDKIVDNSDILIELEYGNIKNGENKSE